MQLDASEFYASTDFLNWLPTVSVPTIALLCLFNVSILELFCVSVVIGLSLFPRFYMSLSEDESWESNRSLLNL